MHTLYHSKNIKIFPTPRGGIGGYLFVFLILKVLSTYMCKKISRGYLIVCTYLDIDI